MDTRNKKGQMGILVPSILALVIAAFVLVLGLQLLGGFQGATDNYSTTAVNESGGFINQTGYTLARYATFGFHSPAIVTIINATSGAVVPGTDYTLTGNVLTNKTAKLWQTVNITYTYGYGQEAYSASNKSIVGTGSFADFWEIIILAVVISVIIGLLLVVLGSRKVK